MFVTHTSFSILRQSWTYGFLYPLSFCNLGKLISTNVAILARAHLDHAPQILEHSRCPPSHGLSIQIESSIEILDSILYNYATKKRRRELLSLVTALGLGYLCKVVTVSPTDLIPLGLTQVIKLLKARSNQVAAVFLLFPTISYIGDTPNGKKLSVSKVWYP